MAGQRDSEFPLVTRLLKRQPLLTVKNERELFEKVRTGDAEARTRIVEAYMPLAQAMATKHFLKVKHHVGSIDLDDLSSAAYEALVRAADRYDPSQGNRFGSYARLWIDSSIRMWVRGEKWWIPGIPDHIYRLLLKLLGLRQGFESTNGRIPTDQELARFILENGTVAIKKIFLRNTSCGCGFEFSVQARGGGRRNFICYRIIPRILSWTLT
jgi:RNA polymerase sigma-B factor